jgi:hypothetical protein
MTINLIFIFIVNLTLQTCKIEKSIIIKYKSTRELKTFFKKYQKENEFNHFLK